MTVVEQAPNATELPKTVNADLWHNLGRWQTLPRPTAGAPITNLTCRSLGGSATATILTRCLAQRWS